ncbi:hypothetical protein AYO47_03490 [Planctomyces sp. SCGC AG-212-M04]|nr:hypothetical protein AYO47_03490 [Planctomyces sp. SCGC AG-212-M04]
MGAVQDDFTLPSGPEADLDIHPPDWPWTDPGGSFASGEIIDRILNSGEAIPEDPDDELNVWQLRSSVCLRGMVEGLKRFEERGGFTSSVPREQRLLLLWVNDSEHPEWMSEWAAELNPSTAAESFARML